MPLSHADITRFLKSVHPYDALTADTLGTIADRIEVWEVEDRQAPSTSWGDPMPGVFVIYEGQVEDHR